MWTIKQVEYNGARKGRRDGSWNSLSFIDNGATAVIQVHWPPCCYCRFMHREDERESLHAPCWPILHPRLLMNDNGFKILIMMRQCVLRPRPLFFFRWLSSTETSRKLLSHLSLSHTERETTAIVIAAWLLWPDVAAKGPQFSFSYHGWVKPSLPLTLSCRWFFNDLCGILMNICKNNRSSP